MMIDDMNAYGLGCISVKVDELVRPANKLDLEVFSVIKFEKQLLLIANCR